AQTMPNIWFKQFGLDKRNNIVQLSGESDDMDAFSRQVKIFEDEKNKKYVTNIGNLNSSLGESARVNFNTNLTLDKNIFSYLSSLPSIVETTSPSDGTIITPPIDEQQNPQTGSTEKLITFFHLLLNPEVSGLVDQTNYKITLDVPYGTDIKNLTPSIIISSNATVSPTSRAQQDFTNPVTYTVTAQDGSTRDYKVTVNILPQVESGQPKWAIWVITILIIIVVAIVAILGFLFWKRIKNQKLNI
ncbi:MAG: DUF5018 domain-containing protein, partial [Candidatus Staskawiczbacteria bacterium]|nr:DUF5018 domain-containing protein [Candidatus Staskawiczbacteria bacterium]